VVLAALDILFKQIAHAGRRWCAAGLSTVVTGRDIRGRGYGTGLVTAARDRMTLTPGLDLGTVTMGDFFSAAARRERSLFYDAR
jgi:hypothetical protein